MYRADHVGSFLRPRAVLDARAILTVDPEQLKAIEDEHILRVLARQKDLGFDIFTDGELRRGGFMSDFYESVDGLDTTVRSPGRGAAPLVRRQFASTASPGWSSTRSGKRNA